MCARWPEERPAGARWDAERHPDAARVVYAQLVPRRVKRIAQVCQEDRPALPAELDGVLEEVRIVAQLEGRARGRQARRRWLAGAHAALDRIARVLRARVAVLAIDRGARCARPVAVALVRCADALIDVAGRA